MPFLTVVSKSTTSAQETPPLTHRTSRELFEDAVGSRRSDLLGQLPKTSHQGGDLRTVLDSVGPLLVKIMRADRGFIRLFSQDDRSSHEDLGVAGLNAGDSIGITESAYMQRLLAGRFVRDGSTLLVPLLCQSQTVGFCCLDRRQVPTPFTDEDAHFIMGIGQAAMTLRGEPAYPGAKG